jgi:broad specificity phosphatase PhoE
MPDSPASRELLLVRHAQSEWNALSRWQGQADPNLSETGLRQAEALAERLAVELARTPIDCLICSDLARAQQTAAAVGRRLGHAPELDPRLRELDVGRWSGLTREEILELDPALLERFEADDPDARPGGGETRREIRLRARLAVEDILASRAGARIMIVSHLGFLRALLPGVEPTNAELIRVDAAQALAERQRLEQAKGSRSSPL